jgi:hypothetical protein
MVRLFHHEALERLLTAAIRRRRAADALLAITECVAEAAKQVSRPKNIDLVRPNRTEVVKPESEI